MPKITFESRLLADGHLYCPPELTKENAKYTVVVSFDDPPRLASDDDIETAAVHDIAEDYLTEDELRYYLNLKEQS